MLLADLGADVLRIDRQVNLATFTVPAGPLDRGRRSVAIDLKSSQGVAAIKRLIRDADVLVEGFRPGVAERLGIGPDELRAINPRLIYGRMTGWGQDGPLAQRSGHDINYISISGALGLMGAAGEKPHPPLNVLGDFAGGGSFLALGILAALFERERSGQGQVIDAAMVDGSSTLLAFVHGMHAAGRWSGERGSNLLDGGAPFYDTYRTADDKYMAVGALEPQFYAELLMLLGIEGTDLAGQMDEARWDSERALFTQAFSGKTQAEWSAIFADSDGCVTPVLSPWEAHLHPHNVARNSFVQIDGTTQPAPAPRFSRSIPDTPTAMDEGGRDPSAALADWGIDASEAAELLATGAIS
jgi:alpha-methylacyl-CoA racemase